MPTTSKKTKTLTRKEVPVKKTSPGTKRRINVQSKKKRKAIT